VLVAWLLRVTRPVLKPLLGSTLCRIIDLLLGVGLFALGAHAVVATGSATATVTGCAISTTGESSRGLHATYAGVINGSDLTIETRGAHCADVATDRG